MSLPFTLGASWIWSIEGAHSSPPPEAASPSHYQVRLFRRAFEIASPLPIALPVHVSADSRYILYCNGEWVGRGPAKGDVNHHFYDTYDVSAHLRTGSNVLAALVIDMSKVATRPTKLGAPCSVMTYAGGFLLEGMLRPSNGRTDDLSTNEHWKVAVDTAHRFQNENTSFEGYQGYFEHRCSRLLPSGWNTSAFDDRAWANATVLYRAERYEQRRDPTSPYGLLPRMIPPMEEERIDRFSDGFHPGGEPWAEEWSELIAADIPIALPAHTTVEVILDAGELTTAFPRLVISGGAGSSVRLTYAEALRLPWNTSGAKLLGRAQPLANLASHYADENSGWTFDRRGRLTGWCDRWEPAGDGRANAPEIFEPLHWRAFRYVGLHITTADTPLILHQVGQRFTAYPYQVAAEFRCSDPRLEKIWTVGLRTMRLCSHETFEDCPYYEQMQYAGDTMITSRLAMLTTGDYRLTRQAIYHFDWSRLSEGLTQSRYPSRWVQIIPSWSLHWITTVRDYAFCSGDLETVRAVMPGIHAVLDWFRRQADAEGLPEKLPFWNITDWCPWWPRGVVPGADQGPTCIISAQYIVALDEAAELCRLIGDSDGASACSTRADALRAVFHRRFWSPEEGLYFDRPGGPELSQYGNAWGILSGAPEARERAQILRRFPTDAALAPGSFFWWQAGFRALDACGVYDRMPEFLGPWHEMVDHGLSTFVEENSYWRSLCHAWSAHPAIEFLTGVLGVRPRLPGFKAIEIVPHICGLAHASGRVCTPHGNVSVAWRFDQGRFAIDVVAPSELTVTVRLPNGESRDVRGGKFSAEVQVESGPVTPVAGERMPCPSR